mmetsp:Transcript_2038/g.5170  ORF Transcript_2038/g.5170 Transcript_2038/m.5170 type:complete len:426 (+) Transcript_2038:100-1377(+)
MAPFVQVVVSLLCCQMSAALRARGSSRQMQAMLQLQLHIASSWIEAGDNSFELPVPATRPERRQRYVPPAGDGHVAVRRRLGDAIAGANSSLSEQNQEELRKYGERYHAEFRARQAVFFSHVSKSAGTTFCACGMRSGCLGFGMDEESDPVLQNCHAGLWDKSAPDDSPHWGAEGNHPEQFDTCDGLAEYATSQNYTLEGNENYLISEGVCPQFWNVVILRDPIERLVSHLSELTRIPEQSPWRFREVRVGDALWNPHNLTPQTIFQEIPILSDNFYIRSLLGRDVYRLPFGAITEEHLEQAKKVVEKFDMVLLKSDNLMDEIQQLMGWTCHASRRMGQSDKFAELLRTVWSPDAWAQVKKQNAFDVELVNHAQDLWKLDAQVFHQPIFAASASSSAQCSAGDCGYLCKHSPVAELVAQRLVSGR